MTSALNSTVHQRGAASPAPRRKRLSTTERLALLERENATCHLCKGIIQPGQAWDVSHEIPLELGGAVVRREGDDEGRQDFMMGDDDPQQVMNMLARRMAAGRTA